MDNSEKENTLTTTSYAFARRAFKLYRHLVAEQKEYVVSKQILRCGTSIGANIAEANQAQSKPDFISKLSIALKEAVETDYWLRLLRDEQFVTSSQAESMIADRSELIRIPVASIKTAKRGAK